MDAFPAVPVHLDSNFCSWFVGFFDGEGYLQIAPSGENFRPRAVITLREDDVEVLREVSKKTNAGNVYHVDKSYDGPNSRDQKMWAVSATAELAQVIVPIFLEFPLRTKKKHEFEIWKYAVQLKVQNYNTKNGVHRLAKLKSQLMDIRNQEWERGCSAGNSDQVQQIEMFK